MQIWSMPGGGVERQAYMRMRNEPTQKKLLLEEGLTYARGHHIAQGAKIADHCACEMKRAANKSVF